MISSNLKDDGCGGFEISLHRNSDFSGYVIVYWSMKPTDYREGGADEVKLIGRELIRGNVQVAPGTGGKMPPIDVATRIVALAVECYLLDRVRSAVDDIGIPRERPTFSYYDAHGRTS